jgi:xanthine dehydrogenase iron-sulfur cluster and FAD-binding subunit A
VRRTVLQPDEMLVDIAFPALKAGQCGTFLKLGLRRAQAISLVNAALVLNLDASRVRSAVITLGAVAPTIIHAPEAEAYLSGRELTGEVIARAAELAAAASRPIDDLRGSAAYRKAMVRVLVQRGLHLLLEGREHSQVPEAPIQLAAHLRTPIASPQSADKSIHTTINGREYVFTTGREKSLLRLLREEAGLTGTKEGCAEGECGACTVFLDGMAVMACLVPAARANGAEIVTVEGVAKEDELHPVQQAFISEGAVQCGYCTPGFIMSAAKLLEERPHPERNEIMQALSGNLCRCTGYYKILQAIELAAGSQG